MGPFLNNGHKLYCCHKHWNSEQEQKPAVAEQQVEVQTDSKDVGMCEGANCCDSKGSSWWDSFDGCHAQQVQGKCGGCEPFTVKPNKETIYCCHKHWNSEQEQNPAVAEQQVEVQTDSKDVGICDGAQCCDSKGSSWWDNYDGCHAQQVQGKCGGCEPFLN